MRLSAWVLVLSAAVLSVPARAEIGVSGAKIQRFDSPMALTLDFPLTDSSQWVKGKWVSGPDYSTISNYVCNNVSLKKFQVSVENRKDGKARISFEGTLAATAGGDRDVAMTIELLKGDEVIGSDTDHSSVEEKKTKDWDARIEVSPSLLTSTPSPKVRITVAVTEN
jgi:hypothetical protein